MCITWRQKRYYILIPTREWQWEVLHIPTREWPLRYVLDSLMRYVYIQSHQISSNQALIQVATPVNVFLKILSNYMHYSDFNLCISRNVYSTCFCKIITQHLYHDVRSLPEWKRLEICIEHCSVVSILLLFLRTYKTNIWMTENKVNSKRLDLQNKHLADKLFKSY